MGMLQRIWRHGLSGYRIRSCAGEGQYGEDWKLLQKLAACYPKPFTGSLRMNRVGISQGRHVGSAPTHGNSQ